MTETRIRRRARGPFPSLRAFFERTGVRQSDIASDAGISEAHLSNIISGKRAPSYELAIILSRLTNVPIEQVGSHAA